jgi:cell wall-associated NlpC family hydrolase
VSQAPWVAALDRVLRSWEGTRYAHGQGLKGVAADCVGFVSGVMDELHGRTLPPPQRGAVDLAWHGPEEAERFALRIADRWPHVKLRPPIGVEPGDVLMVRVGGGKRTSIGHVMVIGADARQAWHAPTGGVVSFTSAASVLPNVAIVWRATGREGWR